jgi:hypothetical protein
MYMALSGRAAARRAGVYIRGDNPGLYPPIEAYCSASKLEAELGRFVYPRPDQPDWTMKVIVRVPRFDGLPLSGRMDMPTAVIAVDLAESVDTTHRQAGYKMIEGALADLRR